MGIISRERALELLSKSIKEVKDLNEAVFEPSFNEWYACGRNCLVRVEAIFGKSSSQFVEANSHVEALLSTTAVRSDHIGMVSAVLTSLRLEVEELWMDEPTVTPSMPSAKTNAASPSIAVRNKNVFVVHGHDHGRMQAVARFVERLDLNPIILHERASEGATIMEKLEKHGDCSYAVVLLTPDDLGSPVIESGNQKHRARQNVILELGYFLGRLGRRSVCALHVEGVEIPSDYSGIVYIPFDKADAWKVLLAREFKSAGFTLDLDSAF